MPPASPPAAPPGGDAGEKGLDFFAELNKAGNFVPVIGKSGTLAQGATPIVIWWDYNALSGRDALNGNPPVEVVVPKSGVVAGVYVQAISAFAPHPNAAKLWMEYLYSDEGQLKWLEGYCHPIRFNALVARRQGAAGAARQAAAGRVLRGRGLPDARGAGGDGRGDQGRLGHHRRRQRPVSRPRAPATAGARASQPEPPLAQTVSPAARPLLGLARHRCRSCSSRSCS